MAEAPLIVLMTDFGALDPFVGILKGVMVKIEPKVHFVDLSHDIPPGDIRRAAIALWQARPYFPFGTFFLCVVDPGVGTVRRPVIVQSRGGTFVGPDNGLFTFILDRDFSAWELQNEAYRLPNPGRTFHGRDIFAPAAAYAAMGTTGHQFGPAVLDPVLLPLPLLNSPQKGILQGEVLYADRFGNLLTSLGTFERLGEDLLTLQPWLQNTALIAGHHLQIDHVRFSTEKTVFTLPDGRTLPWVMTYAEVPEGECAVLVGSSGLLEIVANHRSAAQLLGLGLGDHITLKTL